MSWNAEQLFASKKQDWATPDHVFEHFDNQYCFGLDAAARRDNAKCELFIPPEEDALSFSWKERFPDVHAAWLNPPYGRGVGKWMEHCYHQARDGMLVVALVMARTDTRWWHDWVMKAQVIHLIKGRLKFIGSDGVAGNSAPAPSAAIVWYSPPTTPGYGRHSPIFRTCVIPKQ